VGRADPGTVISELLPVQKLVALAGSVNRRLRSGFDGRRKSLSFCQGDALYFRLRQGPWNFGVLAAALAVARFRPMQRPAAPAGAGVCFYGPGLSVFAALRAEVGRLFLPEWLLRLLKQVKAHQPHIRQIAFTETL
jgi:hypothetical protein